MKIEIRKFGGLVLATLFALLIACQNNNERAPRGSALIVNADQYFRMPQCWGGKHPSQIRQWIPVDIVVDKREEVAFLYVISRNCRVIRYSPQAPQHILVSDQAGLSRTTITSKFPLGVVAKKLGVKSVEFGDSSESITLPRAFKIYPAEVYVEQAQIGDKNEVSFFTLSDLRMQSSD